jgi:Arc/MetJ-type ribon-helix-helix transcriptional regulator
MASGKYASEDELLRTALLALAEEERDLDAVRESWPSGVPAIRAFSSKTHSTPSAASTGSAK